VGVSVGDGAGSVGVGESVLDGDGLSVGDGAGSVGVGESVLDGDGESVDPAAVKPREDWWVPAVAIPAPTTSASSTPAAVSSRATRRATAVDFMQMPPREESGRMVIDHSKPSSDRMGPHRSGTVSRHACGAAVVVAAHGAGIGMARDISQSSDA
jgi:hypothetical protein